MRTPCKFFTRSLCKKGQSCKFVHDPEILARASSLGHTFQNTLLKNDPFRPDGKEVRRKIYKNSKINEDEVEELDDDYHRELSGASVYYNEFGHVVKISLPTDFSEAYITGFSPGTTPESVVDTLHDLGFDIKTLNVLRLDQKDQKDQNAPSDVTAIVRVEDPSFAKELSAKLSDAHTALRSVPVDLRQAYCKKLDISWNKANHTASMDFENERTAESVAEKFNVGLYTCLGQRVHSSSAKQTMEQSAYNPTLFTITLDDVPSHSNLIDLEDAIITSRDKPRNITATVKYLPNAGSRKIQRELRSRLKQHGPLYEYSLCPPTKGWRAHAIARFQEESDARSACSLDNESLENLEQGKITVRLVQSVEIDVATNLYLASKNALEGIREAWKEQNLELSLLYPHSQTLTTLRIDGENVKKVADVRKKLDEYFGGIVLVEGKEPIYGPSLVSEFNPGVYLRLKEIEKELGVIIVRDKAKRQLRFHGPPGKLPQVVQQVAEIFKSPTSTSYDIDIVDKQLSNGKRKRVSEISSLPETSYSSEPGGDCPICLDKAEPPIQTSCHHTYCQDCFEGCCKTAASTSKDVFQIKCLGDGGKCSAVFTLHEIRDYLPSSVFEVVLQMSFEMYIRRHPDAFHYCPTPDCGFIYRCTSSSGKDILAPHTCPKCLDSLCTSCHARHSDSSCADNAALQKLKIELIIKDCPKCKTLIQKSDGCNDVQCAGCMVHICWLCMASFDESTQILTHFAEQHMHTLDDDH